MRKHHYIPKFYLKKFKYRESQNGKRFYVYCFEKGSNSKGANSKEVGRICWEEGFYSTNSDDPEAFEEVYLNKVDNYFARLLRKVLKCKNIDELTQRERLLLCEFIFFTRWRSKAQRKELRIFSKEMFPDITELEIKSAHKSTFNTILLSDKFLQQTKQNRISSLWETSGIQLAYGCVLDNRVKLLFNNTKYPFITTDNPLILKGAKYVNREWFYFPLSPLHLLFFYPPMLRNSIPEITEELVHKINNNFISIADELIIANNKNYLDFLLRERGMIHK